MQPCDPRRRGFLIVGFQRFQRGGRGAACVRGPSAPLPPYRSFLLIDWSGMVGGVPFSERCGCICVTALNDVGNGGFEPQS